MDADPLNAMRGLLRRMVLLMTNDGEDAQKKTSTMLDGISDSQLVAIAQEALSNLKRAKSNFDAVQGDLVGVRQEMERLRKDYALEERSLLQAQKAIKERDDIAAKYKDLQKQLDPEKHQLEVMYAIDEATAELKKESAELRRDLGQRQTEVNELRASKKRLREAIDRLAGKD